MSAINHVSLYQLSGPNAHQTTCPLLAVSGWMGAVAVTTLVLGLLPHLGVSKFIGINTKPLFIITGLFAGGTVGAIALAYSRSRKSYPILNQTSRTLNENEAYFTLRNNVVHVVTQHDNKPLSDYTRSSLRNLRFLNS